MTSEGLWEIFEGDFASLSLMGGRAEGLACADPGARPPIGACGNFLQLTLKYTLFHEIGDFLPTIPSIETKVLNHEDKT